MATSKNLTTLDFESIKDNLKSYLKEQPIFQDYDFEASNINVLLDILAYNTNLNGFYLNMMANEMFLDSALLRDSVISHAKELNYIPRSFRSARAIVDIELYDASNSASIVIPRGTSFTGTAGNKNFTFTTSENITASSTDGTNVFVANEVILYEGDYVQDSYVSNAQNPVRYLITNKTIDTRSLRVTVIEDNGETVLNYDLRDSLFGLGATNQVFFLQAAENDSYEIIFGDGVIGRPPKNNSIILIEYRACNGELPNGIRVFTADDNIGTARVTSVAVHTDEDGNQKVASGGAVPESLESIKFNAPRAFTTQERVVTAQDYATLLKANFSEINDIAAYGGEEFYPPKYGKVIVAVDLKNTDTLPDSYRAKYRDFIKPRSPLSIDPVFIVPNYLYLTINTKVKYDISQTSLGVDDIKGLVIDAIQSFNEINLNGFNKTMRYSKLVSAIDSAQPAIISNDTTVLATQFVPLNIGTRESYEINFDMALLDLTGQLSVTHSTGTTHGVYSDSFEFGGQTCYIVDDGEGVLNIVKGEGTTHTVIAKIGTVDYNNGVLSLDNFATSDQKSQIKFTVVPREKDVPSIKRAILRVLDEDITVQIEQVTI